MKKYFAEAKVVVDSTTTLEKVIFKDDHRKLKL
jgi:hypothetical protein